MHTLCLIVTLINHSIQFNPLKLGFHGEGLLNPVLSTLCVNFPETWNEMSQNKDEKQSILLNAISRAEYSENLKINQMEN